MEFIHVMNKVCKQETLFLKQVADREFMEKIENKMTKESNLKQYEIHSFGKFRHMLTYTKNEVLKKFLKMKRRNDSTYLHQR